MAEVKLTKNELRLQQNKLGQLEKYLPTLQLKKAMLQAEVMEVRQEIHAQEENYAKLAREVGSFSQLLSDSVTFNPDEMVRITEIKKRWENIAGVDVPYFEGVSFKAFEYSLFDTPPWLDASLIKLREVAKAKSAVETSRERKAALEKELREVSIRVNLFEKRLIPRALKNIKKIKEFLGDMLLAAVSQAKVAKAKIEKRKAHSRELHEGRRR